MQLLPVLSRSREVVEAAPVPSPGNRVVPTRQAYIPGVPIGGTTETNPAQGLLAENVRRSDYLSALLRMYIACPWVSDAVDSIAAVVTAGGVEVVPDIQPTSAEPSPSAPPEVVAAQELFAWCNPEEDIVEICRRVVTDLLTFGDAYVEVSWAAGRPVGLWTIDAATMSVLADEHGIVSGYLQQIDAQRTARFAPNEVIHFRLPGNGGLYGVGPTQKAELAITKWLYAAVLIKEVYKQGDPPKLHIDWPLVIQDSEIEKYRDKFRSRNRGATNMANPVETKGGGKVQELQKNRIVDYLATQDQNRDEIISKYHTPPAILGVIEAGNLGGGTGSSQFKTFKVIACTPVAAIVMEKLTSLILVNGFGIKGWKTRFGEYDWRDDLVVEQIRDMRLRNGSWTLNRYRQDIGEPPVEGGDDAVLVDRQNFVLWRDMDAMSKATVSQKAAVPGAVVAKEPDDDDPPKPTPKPGEWVPPTASLSPSWMKRYESRKAALMQELDGDE